MDDVSIHVEKGDICGIIGFSGAGKSTLIRLVNGLETADSGKVTVCGKELSTLKKPELRALRRKIGMVFQQFNLLESKTVYHNIALPLILAKTPKVEIDKKVKEVLKIVELEDKKDTYISQLSGGQKQRVGIARALTTDPELLLCDEATSALDPQTTESILKLLKKINRKMGVTILLITHQMQVVQMICNKVAVMESGKIVESGSVLEVFGSPKMPVTKRFVQTVIRDQIPDSIISLVKEQKENFRVDRLKFIGSSVKRPVISDICKTKGVVVNILGAAVQELEDSVMCVFILQLIGDDEHGWDDDGVFNFEGGCYAKTIKLSEEAEPDIYHAITRDALLENVVVLEDGTVDFNDGSKTENTRVSYPIYHIQNIVKPVSKAGHAKKVIFFTADAFGVLPPVSRLTADQTQYHFLSGFTAKLAGTERGVTEPTPTFSACFGAAFLSLHPTKYAEVLVKRMQAAGAQAYLVNTGWNGTGKRISIKDTRAIIDAILSGEIDNAETFTLPIFDLAVPTALPGVNPDILDPRDTYASKEQWQEKAQDLAQRFVTNFDKYTDTPAGAALVKVGPKV